MADLVVKYEDSRCSSAVVVLDLREGSVLEWILTSVLGCVHILQQLLHLREVFFFELLFVTITIFLTGRFGLVVAELEPASVKSVLVLFTCNIRYS